VIIRRLAHGALRRGSDDKGVAAVEFALVIPLLVVMLFTIVLGGSVYVDQLQLQSVARDVARTAAVDSTRACSVATQELAGNDVGAVQCTIQQNCASGVAKVKLVAVQQMSMPLVGPKTVTLTATSSFVCTP
jgi:Flp pilus assembly protein TadG